LPTHQFLCQQGHIDSQKYENLWQFSLWPYSQSKTPSLQELCPSYCSAWLPIVVLQQSPYVISAEGIEKDIKESFPLDT